MREVCGAAFVKGAFDLKEVQFEIPTDFPTSFGTEN
jgi:hypothetical protein